MDYYDLIDLLRSKKITKQIDIKGSLQAGIRDIFAETGVLSNQILFAQSADPKVLSITWTASFLGETVMDVLTRMSNNFSINLTAIPTETNGFILMLESKEDV